MKRVMIVGQPGAGKSTLARAIGAKTSLPVVHIDLIHWQPGWVERSREEKTRLCREVHARERWVFEGGHSLTWPERLARSDTLIWLDYPFVWRVWRVILRTLKDYGRSRVDLPENCPERFNYEFFKYIWDTRHLARNRIRDLFNSAPADKRLIRLTSDVEVRAFLNSLVAE